MWLGSAGAAPAVVKGGAADLLGELGVGSASVVGPFGLAEPCVGGIFR